MGMYYCHGCDAYHDSKGGSGYNEQNGKSYCDESLPETPEVRKVTRVVMDANVCIFDKLFLKGEVYDSRLRADGPPAADGIQHYISPAEIARFVAEGWAHEQTWEEWDAQLQRNRKANIAACTDPARKAELVSADILHSVIENLMEATHA